MRVDYKDLTKLGWHKFCAEASSIGIRPTEWPPREILVHVDFGNGRPLVLRSATAEIAEYQQDLGCTRLTLFND